MEHVQSQKYTPGTHVIILKEIISFHFNQETRGVMKTCPPYIYDCINFLVKKESKNTSPVKNEHLFNL